MLIQFLGSTGAVLSVVTYLPQVVQLWRTRSAADISMPMLLLLTTGVAVWLGFGLVIKDVPLIVTNGLILTMSVIMIILKWQFDRKV